MSKTAIYARASGLRRNFSLHLQINRARVYLEARHMVEVTVVMEEVDAPADTSSPGLTKLRTLCEQGRIDTIVCASPDRLTRNPADLESIVRWMQAHAIRLHFLSDTI